MKTVKEVANEFNVSELTVRRWIDCGKIKAVRIGRTVRIPVEELERLKRGE